MRVLKNSWNEHNDSSNKHKKNDELLKNRKNLF
jgi:hypothetical protein